MTCIVGIVGKDCMVMGGDSAGVDESSLSLTIRTDPKVFKIRQVKGPDALLGFTSSYRMGQILMSLVLPEDKSADNDKDTRLKFLITKVVPVVRKILRDNRYSKISENTEMGGVFLLGYRNWIYQIHSDFQVVVPATPYSAVGAGEEYALGALDCFHKYLQNTRTLVDIVNSTLCIAEKNCGAVRGPMTILTVFNDK